MTDRKSCTAPQSRTPGPWAMRSTLSGVHIYSPDGVAVARTPCFDRQAQADGALLAAAPDMLEALKNILCHEDQPDAPIDFAAARRALEADHVG